MEKLRNMLLLITGFWTGLMAAQVFFVLAARNGGSPGGEVLIIPAIPLLLWCGYVMGHDNQRWKAYNKGFDHGYAEAVRESNEGSTMNTD